MKKISLFIFIIFLLFLSIPVWAVKESSPPGKEKKPPQEEKETKITITEEKIKALKERVATKVAELRRRQKKALIGLIKSLEEDSLILETKGGEKTILTDEKTRIYRIVFPQKKTKIKLSNLNTGEKVVVFGREDKLSNELTAKIIAAHVLPLNINGVVAEIDRKGGTITVKKPDNEVYVVDIEVYTKTRSWEKGEGLKKSGFSKILIDDRIHIVGVRNKKEEKRMTAYRILRLPSKALGIIEKQESTSTTTTPSPPTETD